MRRRAFTLVEYHPRAAPYRHVHCTSIVSLSLAAMVAAGCGTITGGAVGAAGGAVAAKGLGKDVGKGALIGAGVGAAAGAIYDITKK